MIVVNTFLFVDVGMVPVGADIIIFPESLVTVEANTGSSFTCVGYGSPLPVISWFMEGVEIRNSSPNILISEIILEEVNTTFTVSILEICSFPPEYAGEYSCFVNNSHGNSSSLFYVNVTYGRALLSIRIF